MWREVFNHCRINQHSSNCFVESKMGFCQNVHVLALEFASFTSLEICKSIWVRCMYLFYVENKSMSSAVCIASMFLASPAVEACFGPEQTHSIPRLKCRGTFEGGPTARINRTQRVVRIKQIPRHYFRGFSRISGKCFRLISKSWGLWEGQSVFKLKKILFVNWYLKHERWYRCMNFNLGQSEWLHK